MDNKKQFVLSLTMVCLILGVMAGLQLRTVSNQNASAISIQRVNELTMELKKVAEERDKLLEQNKEYAETVSSFENQQADVDEYYNIVKQELDLARVWAGLYPMEGTGIIVTLDDSTANLDTKSNVDPNAFLIHDEDILTVINELYAAGAEAISINEQRFVSTSAVRCVGPVVTVNDVRIAAPFVITAIGDPEVLEAALKLQGGVVDYLSTWGITINIKKSNLVTVPKYDQATVFKHAAPALSN